VCPPQTTAPLASAEARVRGNHAVDEPFSPWEEMPSAAVADGRTVRPVGDT
jgi:hypothetical protein